MSGLNEWSDQVTKNVNELGKKVEALIDSMKKNHRSGSSVN